MKKKHRSSGAAKRSNSDGEMVYRLRFGLSEESMARLEKVRDKLGHRTNTEVVRDSFRLLEWYLNRTKDDGFVLQLKNVQTNEVISADLDI